MDEVEALPGVHLLKERALWIPDISSVVIADVHLGYESELFEEPFYPRMQFGDVAERMEKLIGRYGPKRVIIDGDLKHEFSKTPYSEFSEVREFLDIMEGAEITLVRGNHDNFIARYLEKRGVEVTDSLELGRFFFIHGHKRVRIPENRVTIIGHEHPRITLRDSIGAKASFPCFLVSKNMIVLPAFSEIGGGTERLKGGGFLSPLLSSGNGDMGKIEIFAVSNRGVGYMGERADSI